MCDFLAIWFEIHLMPHLLCFVFVCFYDEVTYHQRFGLFFDLPADLHLVLLKNNLRSKSDNHKNIIKGSGKIRYSLLLIPR